MDLIYFIVSVVLLFVLYSLENIWGVKRIEGSLNSFYYLHILKATSVWNKMVLMLIPAFPEKLIRKSGSRSLYWPAKSISIPSWYGVEEIVPTSMSTYVAKKRYKSQLTGDTQGKQARCGWNSLKNPGFDDFLSIKFRQIMFEFVQKYRLKVWQAPSSKVNCMTGISLDGDFPIWVKGTHERPCGMVTDFVNHKICQKSRIGNYRYMSFRGDREFLKYFYR